jgi:pimeloyl-ACP methyl ester carboxylesterase
VILEVSGATLHYDVNGDGEPLLFLHGGMGIGADWKYIFDTLPDGYRLIAPDLRGHGRSDGTQPIYSFRQSALDAFALLDHLGVDRVKVIGVSGGGITALHLAVVQPRRVESMVCVSAPPRFPEQAKAIQRTYSESMLGDAERARMRERHPRPGQLEALFAQVRSMPDGGDPDFSRDELGSITADTLIVFGDRDPLYPVSLAAELRESIPNSWLWVIPNAGHGPVFGADGPRFMATALPFLKGVYGPRPD